MTQINKINLKNEKVKREYVKFLKGACGFSEDTVKSHLGSIYRYEDFTEFADFALFNAKQAEVFKKWLELRQIHGKPISLTTCYNIIRFLKKFFVWLSCQSGYKSKICATDIEYLNLDRKKRRIATSAKRERFPTFEQVVKVVESIQIQTEIDQRDRALLAFTLLSAMRDSAIMSLPIGCFNEHTLEVAQLPSAGVKTKASKAMYTYLFKFDSMLLDYVIEWIRYLKGVKYFGNSDPLFPRTKIAFAEGSKCFIANEVEAQFWQNESAIREIFKLRFSQAGLEYFPPHSFRHLASHLVSQKCGTAEEIKAASQNFGHENIGTTLMTYGTLSQSRVKEIISNMDFSESAQEEQNHIQELQRLVAKMSCKKQ